MKTKKPRKKKVYNLKTRLVSKIRSVWRFHPNKKIVKDRCKTPEGFFRCEKCRKLTEAIEVDHISPAVNPDIGWIGYDVFIERLFCDVSNLQGICESCHTKKSGLENKARRKKKSLDKKSK